MSAQRSRNGKRWTVNECLQLQREFELLGLSVAEIALRHGRTPNAIMYKLDQEELADYNVLYNNYHNLKSHITTQTTNKYVPDEHAEDDDEDEDDESEQEDQDYIPEDEEDEDDEEEVDEDEDDDDDDIKKHVMRLEKQVMALTEMFMKQTKNNKSVFSLFA
jgi:hypothetical protein